MHNLSNQSDCCYKKTIGSSPPAPSTRYSRSGGALVAGWRLHLPAPSGPTGCPHGPFKCSWGEVCLSAGKRWETVTRTATAVAKWWHCVGCGEWRGRGGEELQFLVPDRLLKFLHSCLLVGVESTVAKIYMYVWFDKTLTKAHSFIACSSTHEHLGLYCHACRRKNMLSYNLTSRWTFQGKMWEMAA